MKTLDCWIPDEYDVAWRSPSELTQLANGDYFAPALILENGQIVPCGDHVPVFADESACASCAAEIFDYQTDCGNRIIVDGDGHYSIDESRGSLLAREGFAIIGSKAIRVNLV